MRIERFFNTSTPEIDGRKWNPYLGISIQNKAFTPEYIADFLRWAAPKSWTGAISSKRRGSFRTIVSLNRNSKRTLHSEIS